MDHISHHDEFFQWLKLFLKDRGLQFTKGGFKLGDSLGSGHDIDLTSGNWSTPSYSANKPPRWLYQLHLEGNDLLASPAAGEAASVIGGANTAQGDKAGLVVRILPVLRVGPAAFERMDAYESYALFVFHGAVAQGSSSETFTFDPSTGAMSYKGSAQPYLVGAILAVKPAATHSAITIDGTQRDITYRQVVQALASSIRMQPIGGEATSAPVYDMTQEAEVEKLKRQIVDAYDEAGPVPELGRVSSSSDLDADDELVSPALLEVPNSSDLLGIDPGVYRQINAALKSGKQHIMLYGPPGTGKTTLARWIASTLTGGKFTLITGSSDWSSQDIIGGYQPVGSGLIAFVPGVLLKNYDSPLVIDELNRCDIDKVIGPLFTVLSGQQTTLPYRVRVEDVESEQFTILPKPKPSAQEHEFAPGPDWRIVATINSIDKASLYQMSYALSRRFGWVYVDAPRDKSGFIRTFLQRDDPNWIVPPENIASPLGQFWEAINLVRVIGPAPIIDAIRAARAIHPEADFFHPPTFETKMALLDAVDLVILPMLDGIMLHDAEALAASAIAVFQLSEEQQERIRARMAAVAA